MLLRFEELAPAQRDRLHAFIATFGNPTLTRHPAELDRMYKGPAFTFGRTHWSVWEENRPAAVLGAVTECWEAKGEVYLAYIYAEPNCFHHLDRLLRRALESLAPWCPCRLKVVANAFVPGLRAWVESKGFRLENRLVEMVLEDPGPPPMSALTWRTVTPEYAEDFRRVHNAAFLESPNGRVKDPAAMEGALADFAHQPDLLQLGWLDGVPAVTLSLELKQGLEGIVDGLGVHPAFQGRGLGRQGLHHGIRTLKAHGAQRITLSVIDSNAPAMALYRSEGFRPARTLAATYAREMKGLVP